MKVLVTGSTLKIGMAAIYGLAGEGCTIIGADEKALPFNTHSRYLKSHYIHAPIAEDRFYDDILKIIGKENPDVLIPIVGTRQISLHKKEITKYVNVLVPDYKSYCDTFNKKRTHDICRETGISMPRLFTDDEANYLLKNKMTDKMVIKPDYDIGGARGLSFVGSVEELDSARKKIQKFSEGYIIEEYIPGAHRTRTIQLLFNKENKLIAYFILKKIRQWPVTGGNTAYAVSTHESQLLEFVMPFFEKCRWEGPAGAQLIVDERNGKPKLIEINPRFTGSLAFPIQCGVNLPFVACIAALNGKEIETHANYAADLFYMHFSYYLQSVLKELSLTKSKTAFLHQVLNELKQQKVGVSPDKKEFPVYLVKVLVKIKNKIIKML